MAKNRYKQVRYGDKHACGHFAEYMIGGYSEEYREEEAARKFAEDCPDCQRAVATKEAQEAAEEAALIALTGSERQVAWALTIRQEMIDAVELHLDAHFPEVSNPISNQKIQENKARFLRTFAAFLAKESSASEFIERRNILHHAKTGEFFVTFFKWIQAYEPTDDAVMEEELAKDAKAEATIYPENYNGVDVELDLQQDRILLLSPKDDDVIALARSFGYQWSGRHWAKQLNAITGVPEDRVAEMGSHLLQKGFGVVALGVEKEKIIQAEYEPETDRWILPGDAEHVRIRWEGFDDDLYQTARSLPGARWVDGAMWVHTSAFAEVLDFAHLYSFQIAGPAHALLHKAERKKATVDRVVAADPKSTERPDRLTEILRSSDDVLDDLKD